MNKQHYPYVRVISQSLQSCRVWIYLATAIYSAALFFLGHNPMLAVMAGLAIAFLFTEKFLPPYVRNSKLLFAAKIVWITLAMIATRDVLAVISLLLGVINLVPSYE